MIHQYKNNGYNIVLDVNSGSIHVVDDVVYDVLSLMDEENADRYGEAEFSRIADVILKNDYKEEVTKEDLKDVFSDLQELEENGTLFTKDVYKEGVIDFKKRQTVVKALCLHIAHDCNLACRYCFAGEGEYQGDRSLMSYEVGKKALDFLVANSGSRRNLEVDFFGGEPLLN
ncbi:MAG: 4Fe-4S cluster-binding domain-containing protein, partial [Clostridium sp.]